MFIFERSLGQAYVKSVTQTISLIWTQQSSGVLCFASSCRVIILNPLSEPLSDVTGFTTPGAELMNTRTIITQHEVESIYRKVCVALHLTIYKLLTRLGRGSAETTPKNETHGLSSLPLSLKPCTKAPLIQKRKPKPHIVEKKTH